MTTISERLAEIQGRHVAEGVVVANGIDHCRECLHPEPCDAAVLVAALGAVVAMHAPVTGHPDLDHPDYEATWCPECDDYPCDTMTALAAALGAEA